MTSKPSKNRTALSREFLKGLWTKIGTDNWFDVANEFKPDGKWKKSGNTVRGLCLEHQETNPSMDILVEPGFVYCHGCGYREWNPLDFYRKLSGYSTVNVVGDLAARFQIKFPGKVAEKIQAAKDHNDMKVALFRACAHEFREQLIKTEVYAEKAINWLKSRNLDFSTSQMWPIGIVPPIAKIQPILDNLRFGHLTPMVMSYLYPENTFHSIGHIAMFPFSSPTTIGHVKLREPFSKTFRILSDEFADRMECVFGLNTFAHLLGNLQDQPVYGVEGEFDALSIYSHSQAQGHDIAILATGGNFETSLGWLADFGINNLHLLPDNDGGGLAWAQNILRKSANVTRILAWPSTSEPRTDPEEAVGKLGFTPFWQMVESNLFSKADWAYDVLSYQIADVDDSTKIDRVSTIAKCLFDSDRSAFLNRVQTELKIDADLIPAAMSNFDDDSIQGFITKLAKDLRERYFPLFFETTTTFRQFVVYNAETKKLLELPIGRGIDRSRTEIQNDQGTVLEHYFTKLGEPPEVSCKFDKNGIPIPKPYETVTKLRNLCLQQAIEMSNLRSTPRSNLEEMKRGVHVVDGNVYVSNGDVLIKGETIEGEVVFSEMAMPLLEARDRKILFTPGLSRWSEFINSPNDLYEGKGYDLKEIYETIVDLLNSWVLAEKENGLSQKFLAADLLYTTIASAFPLMTMVRLTGQSSSGKSELMSFLYRDRDRTGYYLCEAAEYLDSYSWAGVRGKMAGSKLRLCLDEFEQSNHSSSKQSETVSAILHHIRNASTGSHTAMGTQSMGYAEFVMNLPIFVAGIYSMNEYRDLSRFIPIETVRIDHFQSPFTRIRSKITPAQIKELRRKITLCMFTRIPEIQRTFPDVSHELSKFGISGRFIANLVPAATIMKVIGLPDYLDIIEKFARLKNAQIGNAVDDDEAAPLLKSILRTPFSSHMVATGYPKAMVQLEELLRDPTGFDLSCVGVYLLDQKYMLIRWIEIAATILNNTRVSRARTAPRLRSILANSKYDISKSSLPQTLQTKINDIVGSSANEYDYTIIDLNAVGVSVHNYHPSLITPVAAPTRDESLDNFANV